MDAYKIHIFLKLYSRNICLIIPDEILFPFKTLTC